MRHVHYLTAAYIAALSSPRRSLMPMLMPFLALALFFPHAAHAAYVSSSVNSGSSGNPSAAVPAGAASGDTVICAVTTDDNTVIYTWPAGFTQLTHTANTLDGQAYAVAWKNLTAADTGTYTASGSSSLSDWVMQCALFSGRADITPTLIDNNSNTGNSSPVSLSAPSITAFDGDDLIWIGGLDKSGTNSASFTAPSSFTKRQDLTAGWSSLSIATEDNVSAGPTGTVTGTATLTGGDVAAWYAFLVRVFAPVTPVPGVIFLTSGTSWTVPSDWNSASNTIEAIGGGGGGGGGCICGGGGGGEYRKIANFVATPGANIPYSIGAGGSGGGDGGDTTFNTTSLIAKGGKGDTNGNFGGTGGTGSASHFDGGAGGGVNGGGGGGGGGGAGGPHGAGGAGADVVNIDGTQGGAGGGGGGGGTNGGENQGGTGGIGGNNYSGSGGGGPGSEGSAGGGGGGGPDNSPGAAGGSGLDWDALHGSGGGGGGSGNNTPANGGDGGLYGGGGGAGRATGGNGAQGIIVITYTPLATPDAPTNLITTSAAGGVALSWTAPANSGGSGIASYKIYRDTHPNPTTLLYSQTSTTSATYTDTTATYGTPYYYRVTTMNASGFESAPSNQALSTPGSSGGRIIRLRGGLRLRGGIRLAGSSLVSPRQATVVFLTSGTSWTVPSDWNSFDNTIEVIGGGGGGGGAGINYSGGGGGGGGYSEISNLSLTPGASVGYQIGTGGGGGNGVSGSNGGDTFFNGSGTTCANSAPSVCAQGGVKGPGNVVSAGGAGGASASGVGTLKYSGGAGGAVASNPDTGGGGGGAGGPNGNGGTGGRYGSNTVSYEGGAGGGGNGGGGNGSNSTANASGAKGGTAQDGTAGGAGGAAGTAGTAGSHGSGGGGGGAAATSGVGGNGGNGVEWDSTHGSGGGAGGGAGDSTNLGSNGGAGGLYGGGGGGGGWSSSRGGNGAQGIIVITYYP